MKRVDRLAKTKVGIASAGKDTAPRGITRTSSWWVKLLVLFHVFCITVWACPKPSDELLTGRVKPFGSDVIRLFDQNTLKPIPFIQAYLFSTGTWQYWDMFAPNPANQDWWGDAVIVYKDGSTKRYQYPRMALLSITDKYIKERFRKFYERAHDETTYQILPPQFGLRIALLNYTNPKNPPVTVRLARHWMQIADPGQPQAKDYTWFNYYTYEVDQRRLKQLASERY